MGQFDQGGAEFTIAPGTKKTKKSLKEAIAEDASKVYLSSTSLHGGWSGYADKLPEGTKFNVVGPDPYTKRDWYATVERNGEKVTCK